MLRHKVGETWRRGKELWIHTDCGTKLFHCYVVEQYIGRLLPSGWGVYHLNENHDNYRPDNRGAS